MKTNDDGYTEITSCSSYVGSNADYVGGLVGLLDETARVINCYSYADITGGTTVGGIVGYNNGTTTSDNNNQNTMVMNCMFYGNITSGNKAPIYNGKIISNAGSTGVGTYNYFYSEAPYAENRQINDCDRRPGSSRHDDPAAKEQRQSSFLVFDQEQVFDQQSFHIVSPRIIIVISSSMPTFSIVRPGAFSL